MADPHASVSPPAPSVADGTPRHRSPNYPAIDLKDAIYNARLIFDSAIKRHPVGAPVIARAWEFKENSKSSAFKLALAAVRSFGLLVSENGGKDELLKLSPLALDIVADYKEGTPAWQAAVKKAALLPKIHLDLWNRYGGSLPPDDEIRRYLVREKGFSDKAADTFIIQYRATLSFAKLDGADIITEESGTKDGVPETGVQIGDFVQWESGGKLGLPEPRPVVAFSDCGKFAYVPGSDSGLPVEQLTVMSRAMPDSDSKSDSKTPPPNPFKDTPFTPFKAGETKSTPPVVHKNSDMEIGPRIAIDLAHGNSIEIRMKAKVTRKELERIKKKVFALAELSFIVDSEADEEVDDDEK